MYTGLWVSRVETFGLAVHAAAELALFSAPKVSAPGRSVSSESMVPFETSHGHPVWRAWGADVSIPPAASGPGLVWAEALRLPEAFVCLGSGSYLSLPALAPKSTVL